MARSTSSAAVVAMGNAAETVSNKKKKLSKREKEEIQERVRLSFQGGIVSPPRRPRIEEALPVENGPSTMPAVSKRGIKRKATAMITVDKPKSKRERALIEGQLLAEEWAFQRYGIPKKLAITNMSSKESIPKSFATATASTKTLGTFKGEQERAETPNRVTKWEAQTLHPYVPEETPSIMSEKSFESEELFSETTFTETSEASEPKLKQDLVKACDLIVEWLGKLLAMLAPYVEENTDMSKEMVYTGLVAGVMAIALSSINRDQFGKLILAVMVALAAIKLRHGKH